MSRAKRWWWSSSSMPGRGLVMLSLGVALVACGDLPAPGSEGESAIVLEEVEVGGPPDSTLSTNRDRRAPALADPGVSGALPGGFPEGLPLYQPSVVVESSTTPGARYVVLRADDPPNVVRVGLLAEWEQAGWRFAGGNSYRRAGARVTLELDTAGGATHFRIGF